MRAVRILRDGKCPTRLGQGGRGLEDEDGDLKIAINASALKAGSVGNCDDDDDISRAVELSIMLQRSKLLESSCRTPTSSFQGTAYCSRSLGIAQAAGPYKPKSPKGPVAAMKKQACEAAASNGIASRRAAGMGRELRDWIPSSHCLVGAVAPVNTQRSSSDRLMKREASMRRDAGMQRRVHGAEALVWEAMQGEVLSERTRGERGGAAPHQDEIVRRARDMSGRMSGREQFKMAMNLTSMAAGGVSPDQAALKRAIVDSRAASSGRLMEPAAKVGERIGGRAALMMKKGPLEGHSEDPVQKAIAESSALEARKRDVELRAAMAESRIKADEQGKQRLDMQIELASQESDLLVSGWHCIARCRCLFNCKHRAADIVLRMVLACFNCLAYFQHLLTMKMCRAG